MAPARSSFFSESSTLALATIVISLRSSRAVRQVKMFSASESTQARTEIARSTPAALQHLVVRRPPEQERRAHLVGDVLVLVELIDDDEVVAARLQVACDLPSHAAESADQVVAV